MERGREDWLGEKGETIQYAFQHSPKEKGYDD